MSSNPSDTATNSTSTSISASSSSTHAPSASISSTSTNINPTTTTTTITTATSSNSSMSASSSQATLPLPTRTPSPSPSPSPATATATATATSTATSEEVLSLRSLKEQQREKERRRHKHRHRSRDERKEDETDEERRIRRERRLNETPEQRAIRKAEKAARRAAREQKKHHSVIIHPRIGTNTNEMELMPMGASSEHKSAPISPISPASSDDETSPHDIGDNTTTDMTSSIDENVLQRPLIYYKRSNPVRQRTVKEEGPVQIVFPGNVMCLGESPLKPSNEVSQEHERLVVFSSPNDDQISRTKVFACLLIFLLPADFILVSTIYFQGSIVDDTSGTQNVTDALTYACTVMALFLGFVGMRLKDTRVLTIFIVVFYIDAVLNLIRIYTILQFSHFIIQLAIGHVMTQYKQTLTGSWFAPVN